MMYSMTGFGEAKLILNNINFSIELYTLNSKVLDINIKVPSTFQNKTLLLKNLLQKHLHRGKIDLYLRVDNQDDNHHSYTINKKNLKKYIEELKSIQKEFISSNLNNELIPVLLRLPGVVQKTEFPEEKKNWKKIKNAIKEAINSVIQFRLQEGKSIEKLIFKEIEKIEKLINQFGLLEKERENILRNRRLQKHLSLLEISYDKNRFEQELIYYIEKLNIAEEKHRLQNHCTYLRKVCENEEIIKGKKMGFIVQEINRESNTLGAKAQFSKMQNLVVQIKNHNEQIKEQLHNIL